MKPFTYQRAEHTPEVIKGISEIKGAKIIAGGTNLLDLMKIHVETPQHLIDITKLDMDKIQITDNGGLLLGALVTNADTAYHPEIEKRYPLLADAILAGATPQLRNKATNGGNLLQRTRCYYFYDTSTACNKREPGSGCAAISGYNRDHAVLGHSKHCIATYPSDMAVALAALDAIVIVNGPNGERRISFENFHRLPEESPHIDTNLQTDEIITAIKLPIQGFAQNYAYVKNRDRASYAFALVSIAVGLVMDGNTIKEARIAMGGVAHKPWRNREAESLLNGKEAMLENFKMTADAYMQEAIGFEYNTFKIELAKRSIVRALMQAAKLEN